MFAGSIIILLCLRRFAPVNRYQRAVLIGVGLIIAAIQFYGIAEHGLDDNRGWPVAFLISAVLLFVGLGSWQWLGALLNRRTMVVSAEASRPATITHAKTKIPVARGARCRRRARRRPGPVRARQRDGSHQQARLGDTRFHRRDAKRTVALEAPREHLTIARLKDEKREQRMREEQSSRQHP